MKNKKGTISFSGDLSELTVLYENGELNIEKCYDFILNSKNVKCDILVRKSIRKSIRKRKMEKINNKGER